MRLTERHVALMRRDIKDEGGPPSGHIPMTEDDYQRVMGELLGGMTEGAAFWIFAYGSLIWKPACEVVELRTGILRGWHRAFCLGWNTRFRGSESAPGLMLALDHGGACKGVLYRLPNEAVEANLHKLLEREMGFKPASFPPRWVTVARPVVMGPSAAGCTFSCGNFRAMAENCLMLAGWNPMPTKALPRSRRALSNTMESAPEWAWESPATIMAAQSANNGFGLGGGLSSGQANQPAPASASRMMRTMRARVQVMGV